MTDDISEMTPHHGWRTFTFTKDESMATACRVLSQWCFANELNRISTSAAVPARNGDGSFAITLEYEKP